MKLTKFFLLFVLAVVTFGMSSCSDDETYADQLDRERDAINRFIADRGIKVITESEFYRKDSVTDTTQNKYVYFSNTGIYMQIVRKGCGEKIKRGETVRVLARYDEYNLLESPDTIQTSNNVLYYQAIVDKMTITNTSGSFSGYFDSSSSVMYSAYGSSGNGTAVPSGWLVPFAFVNIGRPVTVTDQLAKVRLIVPSTQGQANASSAVYPCFYEITYERGR